MVMVRAEEGMASGPTAVAFPTAQSHFGSIQSLARLGM